MVVQMNIPEGYKQTDLGVIPDDWEVHVLGDKTIKIGSGITPTGGSRIYKSEGRPFLRSQNIGWGKLSLEDVAYIDDIIHNTFKGTEIRDCDVFLNITGASIGRSAVADQRVVNGNVNQHVCIIRPIEQELNSYFLNCFLLSNKGQKQIDAFQAGGNRQGLNFGQIKSFEIPLPPTVEEQKAIAQSLSDVDALITECDRILIKKRNTKQGTMQQLLTGKKRLPGFSGEWKVEKLRDLTTLMTNGFVGKATTHYTKSNDGVLYIQGFNVIENSFNFTGIKRVTLDFHLCNSKSCLKAGDLLTIQTGDIGVTTIVPKELEGSNCHALIITRFKKEKVSPHFFCQYFNSIYGRAKFKNIEIGTTMKHLNVGDFIELQLLIPPTKEEQKEIAQILSDMDTEIAALEQKRDKYKAIKQGMMQELLTGKTRLIGSY